MPDADPAEDTKTFPFQTALSLEYQAIHGGETIFPTVEAYLQTVLSEDGPVQSALCLSGGGIRSAAFCLGVIQSLAAQGLLAKFHYLSTVSGGGYIGSWLQAWMLAEARARGASGVTTADAQTVERVLREEAEPKPVDTLRGFTSYLTPRPGVASPDTWAGLTLFVRNICINWAVFMPALFALALLPRLYADLLTWSPPALAPLFLMAALTAIGVAAYGGCINLPSHAGALPAYAPTALIGRQTVMPAVFWAFLLPMAVAPSLPLRSPDPHSLLDRGGHGVIVAVTVLITLLAAYGAAWWRSARLGRADRLFRDNLWEWVVACVIACLALGEGIRIVWSLGVPGKPLPHAAWLVVLGPTGAMLTHLCFTSVFVALRGAVLRGDLDREWLGRLSGVKIVPILLWSLFAAVCLLLLPVVTFWTSHHHGQDLVGISSGITTALTALTALSGVLAAVFGRSARTLGAPGDGSGGLMTGRIAAAATIVFGVGLFALLAAAGHAAVQALAGPPAPHAAGVAFGRCVAALALAVVAMLVGWWLGERVNVNRFSLHNMYRNRLTRAFLGSGRERQADRTLREPDPFTGFDPLDNPRLSDLAPPAGQTRVLFPVVGIALNLVGGGPRAWVERKAAPFTATPVACGSESLPVRHGGLDRRGRFAAGGERAIGSGGCFAETAGYGGSEPETGAAERSMGMTLGTAMAVSGAAVSPNMGYYSSPSTAFLMTLFNVRLGIWLPNPATAQMSALADSKPPNALWALFDEMTGRTDYRGSSIYLSDGGHFDNLGLYEMVRRGCRLITVIDAGEDGGFGFADLGNSLRKIRIDQRVEIDFPMPMPMGPEASWKDTSRPFALAKMSWTAPVPATGFLLYIKPCLFDGLPVDLRAYARTDPSFPADSTLDQFFTESRFESYRKLGVFIADKLCDSAYCGPAVTGFLASLRGTPKPPADRADPGVPPTTEPQRKAAYEAVAFSSP